MIESGRINVEDMLTHRFPLAEAAGAIDTSAKAGGIRVAVEP